MKNTFLKTGNTSRQGTKPEISPSWRGTTQSKAHPVIAMTRNEEEAIQENNITLDCHVVRTSLLARTHRTNENASWRGTKPSRSIANILDCFTAFARTKTLRWLAMAVICLFVTASLSAQEKKAYIHKNGTAVFETAVSGIDSIIFYYPTTPPPATDNLLTAEYIPDANFRDYLRTQEATWGNNDGKLSSAEAAAVTGTMDIANKGIANLKGIEYFTGLHELWCINNQLTSLDVSNNTMLNSLNCGFNQIISLTLPNSVALIALLCLNNQLTSLDVSNNPGLYQITCGNNPGNGMGIFPVKVWQGFSTPPASFTTADWTYGGKTVKPYYSTDGSAPDPGTAENPIQVATVADLQKVASETDGWTNGAHYIQTAHIDLGSISNWTPLPYFYGTYDGDGYTISNLKITDVAGDYKGLFYALIRGTVKNLALKGVAINGWSFVGGIAGSMGSGAKIQNSYVTGSVSGGIHVGGIVGSVTEGTVENCYTICTVTGADNNVGGIAGNLRSSTYSEATVQYCYATGTVQGRQFVGGIAGRLESNSDKVQNCVALQSSLQSNSGSHLGRVAGSNGGTGNLTNNYGRGAMTHNGTDASVGLNNRNGQTIDESFVTGINVGIWFSTDSNVYFHPGFNNTNWDSVSNSPPHVRNSSGTDPNFKETQDPTAGL